MLLCVLQFDALQTCSGPSAPVRRPPCNTLLDVFENIRCERVVFGSLLQQELFIKL
jgi:hypothetical protein